MPRLVAIDLGSHAVKVSVFHTAGRRSSMEAQYAQPVPQNGDTVPTLGERLAALDALLDEHPAWANPGNDIGLVWPSSHASVRRVTLPFTDRAQVDKTLPFTVEGEVPFDLEDMVLGWRPLSQEDETVALVTLVRHDVLAQWLESLHQRGLDPRSVYLDGELLGRWAQADETVAVIDVGHTNTVISVVQRGRVVAVRSIDVGGRSFTQAIRSPLGCTWHEAEELKHSGQVSAATRKEVDAQMGLLLAEIRSTLVAAEDDHGLDFDHVVLTGAGARMEPLPEYLVQDLGIPVHRPVAPGAEGVEPAFAAAHALNLVQVDGPGKDALIPLRSGSLAYKGGVNVLRAVMVYGSVALTLFLFATMGLFVLQYRSLAAEQADLEGRIRDTVAGTFADVPRGSITNSTTAMAIMSERTLAATERAEVLASAGERPPVIDALHALTKAFPPANQVTVEVSTLNVTPSTISFDAETDGYASAAAVEEALTGNERFAEAAKSGERKVRDKVVFTMTIPIGQAAAGGE